MTDMKEYAVYFEQLNQQCIVVKASSPKAAAKKAEIQMRQIHPDISIIEWVNNMTHKWESARPEDLGL